MNALRYSKKIITLLTVTVLFLFSFFNLGCTSYTPFHTIHCKKELAIFPSPAGMSLTKLSLGGKKLNYSRPGRVWSVTSQLGTGKRPTLFNSVIENYLSLLIFIERFPNCFRNGPRNIFSSRCQDTETAKPNLNVWAVYCKVFIHVLVVALFWIPRKP